MEIRKAVLADLDGIARLYDAACDHLEAHENYPGWAKGVYPTRADVETGLRENALYAALVGERIVGSFLLRHRPETGYENVRWLTDDDYDRIYVVYTLVVHPDFLHRGIGTEMLRYIEALAAREHCSSIRLDVTQGNKPAARLYQKNGFQRVGTVSLGYEAYGLPWFDLYEKLLPKSGADGIQDREEKENVHGIQ